MADTMSLLKTDGTSFVRLLAGTVIKRKEQSFPVPNVKNLSEKLRPKSGKPSVMSFVLNHVLLFITIAINIVGPGAQSWKHLLRNILRKSFQALSYSAINLLRDKASTAKF
ncbi:MAG: hypothetical protein WBP93_04255, partial [Pyrinomonadaceae bacterium]